MTAYRRIAQTARRLVPVVTAPLLLTGLTGVPALAHGAPTTPLSRAAACGSEGGQAAKSAACRAARAANGDSTFTDWDNVRVANVNGRDRSVIEDGKLCSGGVADYRGLDLAREDWPATTLTAGASLTFTYRGTIPHEGEFRFYLTRAGYDPTQPLRWSDLESKPFLRATDPTLKSGSYRIKGKLPAGRTGRNLIFTIWQNSSTPDTYYSCSDVVFRAAKATASPSARASKSSAPAVAEDAQGVGVADEADSVPPNDPTVEPDTLVAATSAQRGLLPLALGGVLVVALATGLVLVVRRRRS